MKKKFEEDSWSETSSDSEQEVRVKAIPQQNIQREEEEIEEDDSMNYQRTREVARGHGHE
jgi:hypothetical protein